MCHEHRVLSSAILRKIIDSPEREATINALVSLALSNIVRAWPTDASLEPPDIESLTSTLHWFLHICGEAERILVLSRSLDLHRVPFGLSPDAMAELQSACSSMVLHLCVLMSGEASNGLSVFLTTECELPRRLAGYIDPRRDSPDTEFDLLDKQIERRWTNGQGVAGRQGLVTLVGLSSALLGSIDWLLFTKRPPRGQLRRCLKYLHAWVLELCSNAAPTSLWLQ